MERKSERKGWVEWSLPMLCEQLGLPDSARVLDVKIDLATASLQLLIEHPGLPIVYELEIPPKVRVQYKSIISSKFEKWDY